MHGFWVVWISLVSLLSAGEVPETSPRSTSAWAWKGTPVHSTRWTFLSKDSICWSSSETGTVVDSLLLYWPRTAGRDREARLSFLLTGRGDSEAGFFQVGLLGIDSVAVLSLPYSHISPELPGKNRPNSYSSTVTASLASPVDLTRSHGIILRTVAYPGSATGTLFILDSLFIADTECVTPLVPFPQPEVIASDTESVHSAVWHIPETSDVIWELTSPWQTVPIPTVAVATAAITGSGYDLGAIQMGWSLSRDVPCLEFTDMRGGYFDPLTFLQRSLYIQGTGVSTVDSVRIRFSLAMPGLPLTVSEPAILMRSPSPYPGEVLFNEIVISPVESEFIEIRSLLQWPVELGSHTLQIEEKGYPLPHDLVISPLGIVQVTGADVDGLTLPNSSAHVELRQEKTLIDRVSYGPTESLPSAPYGWSLARKNGEWILESDPSPGVSNGDFEPPLHEQHALEFSELALWPRSGEDSFIEIVNRGDSSVNLDQWALLCEDVYFFPDDHVLEPGSFLTMPGKQLPPYFLLNPDEGSVVLVQPNGVMADRCSWQFAPDPGRSLHKADVSDPSEPNWIAALPSPGIEPSLFGSSHCEIRVSRTNDGVVIQWSCAESDSLVYHVYRAHAGSPNEREQISIFPIRGPEPYSFVDITAEAGESYLYWVAPDPHTTQADWSGPAHIPPAPEDIGLILAPPKPNPFRDEVIISYAIERLPERLLSEVLSEFPPGRRMKLGAYNVNGRLVRVLETDVLEEGHRSVTWDGRDENGQLCPPGVYVISLQIGSRVRSVKAVFTGNEVGLTPGGSTR